MKRLIIALLGWLAMLSSYAQDFKEDRRPQIEKENLMDYLYDEISEIDILDALEMAGLLIHKFQLGEFDKKYRFILLADEYVSGTKVKSDTLLNYNNVYDYYLDEEKGPFSDYLDQIKIITKTADNSSTLKIILYNVITQKEIGLTKLDNRQFYVWREYKNTHWKKGESIPLMIFASSWYDKKYNLHRFCGVTTLSEGDEDTIELLTSSPNYIIISYQVNDID